MICRTFSCDSQGLRRSSTDPVAMKSIEVSVSVGEDDSIGMPLIEVIWGGLFDIDYDIVWWADASFFLFNAGIPNLIILFLPISFLELSNFFRLQ